jgi:GMP synthase (glutamine-hydrolysing)
VNPSGHQSVLILDYGSQYTRLIARRIREQKVFSEIHPSSMPIEEIRRLGPVGIVLSGGPDSVYDEEAQPLTREILDLGVPILAICYGMQLLVHALGGRVSGGGKREYGDAEIDLEPGTRLFEGLSERERVWMSHGDEILELPPGFRITGRSLPGTVAGMESAERGIHGIQFHPEVDHTPGGARLIRNFLYGACGCTGDWTMSGFALEAVEEIRRDVGPEGRVLCGLSGGVDSTVTAVLIHRAVGDRLIPLFVDTGLLRKDEAREVLSRFAGKLHIPVRHRDASDRFLKALAGVAEPEAKRRIIGEIFVRVFEEEALAAGEAGFLGQGTLYPDRIESSPVKGTSHTIKTHHNVGGLPERMKMRLIEPLRDLFKDEVRSLAIELGVDEELVRRHPFPGPGLSVRIPGEITPERVAILQEADAIFIEEIVRAGLYDRIAQAFAVLLPVRTVGVMGDVRTYENVLALRAVETADFMTASWSRLPHELLARVSSRIVNEVRGINRVVYDISNKPPATIEWE